METNLERARRIAGTRQIFTEDMVLIVSLDFVQMVTGHNEELTEGDRLITNKERRVRLRSRKRLMEYIQKVFYEIIPVRDTD